jgi:hypothetical protein
MPTLYTALAILGWLAFCAIIAWFVSRVLDYAAQLFQEEADQFANADRIWGEVVNVPEALRPSHIATEPSERAKSNASHSLLLSTPPSCGR